MSEKTELILECRVRELALLAAIASERASDNLDTLKQAAEQLFEDIHSFFGDKKTAPQSRREVFLNLHLTRFVTIRLLVVENKIDEAIEKYFEILRELKLHDNNSEDLPSVSNMWKMARYYHVCFIDS
jgi:hypothetical protein